MSICGSNLIPIFITLLCCGAIFVYFNLRLNEIKFAVEKQNRVLTAFITNVQQDIRAGGCMMPMSMPVSRDDNNLAAPEAIFAAQKFMNENSKIVVSDDEDDDDDDDDSDSDSSDEEDDEVFNTKNIKIVNLQEKSSEQMIPIAFEVLTCVVGETTTSNVPESSSITEITDETVNIVSTVVPTTFEPTTYEPTTYEPTTYEQMKVDELRKVATDKNLASKEEIKKMKKPELLGLLKK